MTPKNNYLNFTPYVLVLAMAILGIFGYNYYNNIIDDLSAKLAKYDSNQIKVEGEFAKINDEYNSLISSLSEKDQLLMESQQSLKDKNEELKSVLNKQKITESDLAQAQVLIAELKSQIKFENSVSTLDDQIKELQEKNKLSEREIIRYQELIKEKETLVTNFRNEIKEKNKIIKLGSSLRLVNFDIKGVNVKANGREVETDKARKADKLRVSFYVNSNNISDSGDKDLYLSLYNTDRKLANFPGAEFGTLKLQNGKSIDYTDHIKFYYEKGSTAPVKFDWENDNFEKGEYTIEVYENGMLIGAQNISFR